MLKVVLNQSTQYSKHTISRTFLKSGPISAVKFVHFKFLSSSWSGYGDELGWSAAWLYRATNEQKFRDDVDRHWNEFGLGSQPTQFSWDDKKAGLQVLMPNLPGTQNFQTLHNLFAIGLWIRPPDHLKVWSIWTNGALYGMLEMLLSFVHR